MSFLHLVRWTPSVVEALAQVDIFVRSLGQVDLGQASHQADLWSDVPPIVEASTQVDIFVRPSGQADLWSNVPLVATSCGQVWYYIGQADLWTDVPPADAPTQVDIFVRSLGWAYLWSDVPTLVETSCGKVCYYFRYADLWSDGFPLDEVLGQVDISSDFVLAGLLFFPHSISY